jgi:invasion protein IalB
VKTKCSNFLRVFSAAALALPVSLVLNETVVAQSEGTPQTAKRPAAQVFGPRVKPQQQQQQQGQQRRGPPPEIVATYDDWKIQCETVRVRQPQQQGEEADPESSAASGKSDNAATAATETRKFCGMIQSTRSEKRPQIGLTLFISRTKQGDKTQTQMRVMAPIGVFLPTGVGLEIDGVAVSRVPFSNCLPQICLARAEASPETLDKLKKGSVANFIIWEGPGAGMPMKISLKGFGKALDALDQL